MSDPLKKIVVAGGSRKVSLDESGIVTMGIKQFLLDQNSLEL